MIPLARYRALTKIRLRKEPDVASEPTGETVETNILRCAISSSSHRQWFLKALGAQAPDAAGLTHQNADPQSSGQGIAGRWLGKPIIEPIEVLKVGAAPPPVAGGSSRPPAPSAASQPPQPAKAAPPPSAASQPPQPAKAAPPPSAASQPPQPAKAAPPPSAASQPPQPAKAAPPPSAASQPPQSAKAAAPPKPTKEAPPVAATEGSKQEPRKTAKDSADSQTDPAEEESALKEELQETSEVEAKPLVPAVAIGATKAQTARLPDEILGAGFEFVRLAADKTLQPLTFMLGNGFPCNALTTRGRALLDVESSDFKGGWLSQAEVQNKVDLTNVRFLETGTTIADLPDCSVMDFPQAMLAEQLGIEVHGILGQPFFKQYDLDLDRYRARAELYLPGEASTQGFYSGVKHLPGIELPAGNLGLAVKGKAVGEAGEDNEESDFAFIGLVDSSAAHTVLNWEAAKLLGFAGPSDPRLAAAAKVLAASADGSAEEMPVTLARLSLCSAPEGVKPMLLSVTKEEWESTGGKGWYFEDLSGGDVCIEFGAVNVAIGNPLSLSVLADSKIGPFTGAAAIIGQDLLFQALFPVMLCQNWTDCVLIILICLKHELF
ncbi:unnamed protein product [Cladocopium goreaui]|uniref:Glycine-rich domain-containing protein n=1 Tax=Cladocopium goreaui TaxID=2562237 RepID=A0A9P1GNJ1_9DINO|nr:unnamed protein product [Cladocopium goreaui]